MAVVSDLTSCLMWETERPYPATPRQSSYFRLFGEEWCLRLTQKIRIYSEGSDFLVRLFSSNGEKTVETGVSVTCHARLPGITFGGSEQFSIRNSESEILQFFISSRDLSIPSVASQTWKMYCCISCAEPLSLRINNETIHLSTGSSPTSSNPRVQTCPGIPPDLQRLSDDLSRLLDKEIIPDSTLTCGGQTWRLHRSVLTVRSEVFAALFRSGMSESETGVVRVEDLEPTVLDSLLKYVYGGKVPDVSGENVSGLYEAADRYALHGLRKLLSSWMAEHLSNENCLGFLVLADPHGDAELKEATVAFITKHFAQIEKAVWANFRKEHMRLAVEVLEHFAPTMK